MSRTERIVIYAALLALAAIELPRLLDSIGPPAHAEPARPAVDEAGPYSSLVLSGGDGNLVLRSRDARLAWADDDYSRALSMAFVHLGKIMAPLLETDRYVEEREDLEAEIREVDEDLMRRMDDFREAHMGDEPGEPEDPAVRAEREALLREYESWNRERSMRLAAVGARQIEAAYREIVEAVEVVADRLDIDLVYRFIPTADEFQSANPSQAYMAIRARTVLRYPSGLEITDRVLEEMALDAE